MYTYVEVLSQELFFFSIISSLQRYNYVCKQSCSFCNNLAVLEQSGINLHFVKL